MEDAKPANDSVQGRLSRDTVLVVNGNVGHVGKSESLRLHFTLIQYLVNVDNPGPG